MHERGNTHYLWSVLLGLIYLFVFVIIISLAYIPLKPMVDALFLEPKHDPVELALRAKNGRAQPASSDLVENGIHLGTGLPFDQNFQYIKSSCLSCHSPKLITQNRATREGWKDMIAWMQATQGLPDLGKNEPMILDYLSKHFAPKKVGRRPNLNVEEIEWYILEL